MMVVEILQEAHVRILKGGFGLEVQLQRSIIINISWYLSVVKKINVGYLSMKTVRLFRIFFSSLDMNYVHFLSKFLGKKNCSTLA